MTSTVLTKSPCLAAFSLLSPGPQTLDFEYSDVLDREEAPIRPKTVYVLALDAPISQPEALLARLYSAGSGLVLFKEARCARRIVDCLTGEELPAVWSGESDQPACSLALSIQQALSNGFKQKLDNITTVSHQFSLLSLELAEIQTIIDYFKKIIQNPIAVYDEYFRLIAVTDDYVTDFREYSDAADHIFLHNLHFLRQRIALRSADAPCRECVRMLFPIILESKRTRAYLAVFEINALIEHMDITIFEISTTSVILAIKRQISLQSIEEKYISDFIYDLIYRKDSAREELVRRARVLGIPEQTDYLVMGVDINIGREKDELTYVDAHVDIYDRILSMIDTVLNGQGRSALVARFGKSIVLIHQLSRGDNTAEGKVRHMIRELLPLLQQRFQGTAFYIGIGRRVEQLQEIAASYREAVAAISFGAAAHPPEESFLVSYEDSSLLRIFGRINDRDILHEIIPESLVALRAYDQENHTNLYETLCVYLDHNCNAKKSSERLYIHYKTMLYRLDKIKREFGIEVENRHNRIQVELGIEMLNMMNYP